MQTVDMAVEIEKKEATNTDTAKYQSGAGSVDSPKDSTEVAELRERFSLWSTVGVQYSIVAAPLTIGSYISFILGVGGSPFFFYTYIVCFVFQMFVCLTVAEIASCHPHTLGKFFDLVILHIKHAHVASRPGLLG